MPKVAYAAKEGFRAVRQTGSIVEAKVRDDE